MNLQSLNKKNLLLSIGISVIAFIITTIASLHFTPWSDVEIKPMDNTIFWPVSEINTVIIASMNDRDSSGAVSGGIAMIILGYIMYYWNVLTDKFLPDSELDGIVGFIVNIVTSWMIAGAGAYIASVAAYYSIIPAFTKLTGSAPGQLLLLLICLVLFVVLLPGCIEILHFLPYYAVVMYQLHFDNILTLVFWIAVVIIMENDKWSPLDKFVKISTSDGINPIKVWLKIFKMGWPDVAALVIGSLIVVAII